MDFKIVITCEKCKCSFELRPSMFADKKSLLCANCGQELEQEVFSHLKTGLIELSKVPDVIPENSDPLTFDPQKRPRFSIHVKEFSDVFNLIEK